MKIIRNGEKYALTREELFEAADAYNRILVEETVTKLANIEVLADIDVGGDVVDEAIKAGVDAYLTYMGYGCDDERCEEVALDAVRSVCAKSQVADNSTNDNGVAVIGIGLDVTPFIERINKEHLIALLEDSFVDAAAEAILAAMNVPNILAWCCDHLVSYAVELFWYADAGDYLTYQHLSSGEYLYCPQIYPWKMSGNEPETEAQARQLLVKAVQELVPDATDEEIEGYIKDLYIVNEN